MVTKKHSDMNMELMNKSKKIAINNETNNNQEEKRMEKKIKQREANRKCRMRKEAYITKLEKTVREQATQIQKDLHVKANMQGDIKTDPLNFTKIYSDWFEEHQRLILTLRKKMMSNFNVSAIIPTLDAIFSHYNELFQKKRTASQINIFSILYGVWMPPPARCIMWIGGFRPSNVIELLINHVEMSNEQKKKMLTLKAILMKEETKSTIELDNLQITIDTSLSGQDFVNKWDACAMTNFATHMSALTGKFTIFWT
ncbi:transcription factor HBP-1b(c38)-like [Rutidosis leptorrhynchoides]|uniref:transcription factor HBP-1b(c38)-like n=1 Tax=Rutidosis leptorrhynchoides TaxID=125765 RepID=UPI003A993211